MEKDQLTEFVVYSSQSQIAHPIRLIKRMIADLWRSRSLAFNLMKRDISVLYRQSFLGFFWAFIPPLLTALTFSIASRNKVLNIGATDMPYTAYVLFGVTLWQTFSEAVLGPVNGLTSAKSFIAKINLPHEALFMAKFGEAIFNFGVKSIMIAGIFIFYGISPAPTVFLAIGVVFCMLLLGQAIGLLLAPINIIYQDIGKGLPLILGLGMLITPVVYPLPVAGSVLGDIVRMNPLTYLISGVRDLSVHGTTAYTTEILLIFFFSIILFLFSWMVFKLSMPYVIERCS